MVAVEIKDLILCWSKLDHLGIRLLFNVNFQLFHIDLRYSTSEFRLGHIELRTQMFQ